MTQKDKELLLKDLCARFAYGVRLQVEGYKVPQLLQCIGDYDEIYINDYSMPKKIEDVKPYLRPMSSMTMEEEKEYCRLVQDTDNGIEPITNLIDWLNAHHFDYRGLIEKGLALEAPKGMYQ